MPDRRMVYQVIEPRFESEPLHNFCFLLFVDLYYIYPNGIAGNITNSIWWEQRLNSGRGFPYTFRSESELFNYCLRNFRSAWNNAGIYSFRKFTHNPGRHFPRIYRPLIWFDRSNFRFDP